MCSVIWKSTLIYIQLCRIDNNHFNSSSNYIINSTDYQEINDNLQEHNASNISNIMHNLSKVLLLSPSSVDNSEYVPSPVPLSPSPSETIREVSSKPSSIENVPSPAPLSPSPSETIREVSSEPSSIESVPSPTPLSPSPSETIREVSTEPSSIENIRHLVLAQTIREVSSEPSLIENVPFHPSPSSETVEPSSISTVRQLFLHHEQLRSSNEPSSLSASPHQLSLPHDNYRSITGLSQLSLPELYTNLVLHHWKVEPSFDNVPFTTNPHLEMLNFN